MICWNVIVVTAAVIVGYRIESYDVPEAFYDRDIIFGRIIFLSRRGILIEHQSKEVQYHRSWG